MSMSAEQWAGVIEIRMSGKRIFRRSRSAHMLWLCIFITLPFTVKSTLCVVTAAVRHGGQMSADGVQNGRVKCPRGGKYPRGKYPLLEPIRRAAERRDPSWLGWPPWRWSLHWASKQRTTATQERRGNAPTPCLSIYLSIYRVPRWRCDSAYSSEWPMTHFGRHNY